MTLVDHAIDIDMHGELARCNEKTIQQAGKPINLIVLAGTDVAPRPNFTASYYRTVLGRADTNCVIYSVPKDECGLVLFHELDHILKMPHLSLPKGACASHYRDKYNVMDPNYTNRWCSLVTFKNIETSARCIAPINFENSLYNRRYRPREYDLEALNENSEFGDKAYLIEFLEQLNNDPFSRADVFPRTIDSEHVNVANEHVSLEHLKKQNASPCSLSPWSVIKSGSDPHAPYTVYFKTRQCVCTEHHFGECDGPLQAFEVSYNPRFRKDYEPFESVAHNIDKTRDCKTDNGCAYKCAYDILILLQAGSSCAADGKDGVCVNGTCVILDMIDSKLEQRELSSTTFHTADGLIKFANTTNNLITKCTFKNVYVSDAELESARGLFPLANRSLVAWLVRGQDDHSIDAYGHANCVKFATYLIENNRFAYNTIAHATLYKNVKVYSKINTSNYRKKPAECWYREDSGAITTLNVYTCAKYSTDYFLSPHIAFELGEMFLDNKKYIY